MSLKNMGAPRGRVSDTPGNFRGLGKTGTNVKRTASITPKGAGTGIKPPRVIAEALGVDPNQPVHKAAVGPLLTHPNQAIADAAKRLMAKY